MVHRTYVEWVHGEGQGTVISTDEKGECLRDRFRSHVLTNDGENKCLGVEMGSRNFPSPIVLQGTDDLETPEWNEKKKKNYIPSTSRGARAPHVFLRDGDTSIHDLLGFDYSLVDFTTEGNFASSFKEAASHLGIPIATVHLPNEQHARDLWERGVVLVRPDLHVAWRLNKGVTSLSDDAIKDILLIAVGKK
ncbi:hypothetical protein EIK77_008583 [Talaromyces pinophilus]|nr:hypothetical protein EIK77_008583 [Talaromyces pinophilus]